MTKKDLTQKPEMAQDAQAKEFFFERATRFIGSTASLVLHSIIFIGSFLSGYLGFVSWSTMLLVLTTLVSLEAIFLAIFIQMSVNRQAVSLREVEEDVEGIQENVEDIQEDIQEITEDVEDIQEDVEELNEEDSAEEKQTQDQLVTLERLTADMQRVLKDLETFKKQ